MTHITLPRETVQQAIDALYKLTGYDILPSHGEEAIEAITALRNALEAAPAAPKEHMTPQEQQAFDAMRQALEVVEQSDYGRKWVWPDSAYETAMRNVRAALDAAKKVQAAPAAREPLTAAQIRNLPLRYPVGFGVALLVARATEAAHGIGKENT